MQKLTQNGSDLNVKHTTMKTLGKNTGEDLWNLEVNKESLDLIPKARSIKRNINKLDFIKIINFCSSKGSAKRMKS